MHAVISYTDHNGKAVSYMISGDKFKSQPGQIYNIYVEGLTIPDGATMITCEIYDANNNFVTYGVDSINSYLSRAVEANGHEVYEMLLRLTQSAYAKFHP